MANSIDLAAKFMPILDEVYKRESLTGFLDALTKPIEFSDVNEVKIFKTSVVGLGTYSRASGYPAGDVTATWESIKLEQERGRALSIDRMDNEESLGMAFGTLSSEFIRTQVVPEVDAFRLAKYGGYAGIQAATPATLDTATKVINAIDVASGKLDDEEVPDEGRVLFIALPHYRLLNKALTRQWSNDQKIERRLKVLDGLVIKPVPQGRFYSGCTLNAGATASAGGYANSGKAINFLMLHPTARGQATKLANLKIFTPDQNQTADSWLFQYRLYHDAWVYDNKLDGIYVHTIA